MTVTMWLIALVALAALAAMAAWARRDERVRDAELKAVREEIFERAGRLDVRTIEIRERLIELERRVNIIDNVVTQHSEELDELQRTKHGNDAVAVPTVTEDEENGDQEKSAPEWMVDAGAAGASGAAPETMAEADPEETTPPWTVVGADPETIDGYFNTGE